jgi:hypothetical protein
LAAVTLGACSLPAGSVGPPNSPSTTHGSEHPASAKPEPASLAGGACLLLDYATINTALGTNFDVAASADKSDSYTCVVQSSSDSFPDLTLSITATDLSASDFQSDVAPPKSKKVSSLGKVGYEIEHAASGGNGPTIEVGWLSGNERLIVMMYAYAPDEQTDPTLVGKMDELARAVDGATV